MTAISSAGPSKTAATTERSVLRLINGEAASDGAGVRLTRVIGARALSELDPFLLLDEFRSDDPNDYIAGFPDHPHRGFETVTYLIAGRVRHADNKGHRGVLTAGSVQWMTAGRGIVHSEMPEQEHGLLWGFQLWVNLPARDKLKDPRYQEIEPQSIPEVSLAGGGRARVVAGEFGGRRGPIDAAATEPLYLDLALSARQEIVVPVPPSHNAFTYAVDGSAAIGPEPSRAVSRGTLAVLGPGESVTIRGGGASARLLLIAGKPLNEPVARYGPFAMNSADEIRQAVQDFQAGRF